MWTRIWDMHSGGDSKEPFEKCYIEAPLDEAESVFYARFGHSPHRVTCTCCGPDYCLDEYETLEEATAFHQRGKWGKDHPMPLEEYLALDEVRVIRDSEITDAERQFDVPRQGYVWVD